MIVTDPNSPRLWRHALPLRAGRDHKYTRGHCLVWSGPELATGASRLAARAALRIGAGLVTLCGSREALRIHAAHVTAIMLREIAAPEDWPALLADPRIRAVVIGPAAGMGEATRAAVMAALASNISLVLDADALTAFENCSDELFAAIKARQAPVILTPHEGEFTRLFGAMGLREESLRAKIACKIAQVSGAILVLKGHNSTIATSDGRVTINTNAPPTLATAGSGDVLAGMIGGLLAQGMPGFEAAAAGVWLHGETGRLAGPRPIADDLVETIAHLPDFASL